MSDAIERITMLTGAAPAEMLGPVLVHSGQLFGAIDEIIWGTTLYGVRSINCAGGSAGPVTFAASDGKVDLFPGVSADWKLYAEFDAGWHAGFAWQSTLGTDDWFSGVIDRAENNHLWYFVTPPGGNPEGEFSVSIAPTGGDDPEGEFILYSLNFYLFR